MTFKNRKGPGPYLKGGVYGIKPPKWWLKNFSPNSAWFYSNYYNFLPTKGTKHCHQKRFVTSKYSQNAFILAHGAPPDPLAGLGER